MKIVIGNDHRAVQYKQIIVRFLEDQEGIEVTNIGVDTSDSVHYPFISKNVANTMNHAGGYDCGILICGSGHGVNMAVNRYEKIRGVTCRSVEDAVAARRHNNANVLCLGADFTDVNNAVNIVKAFLQTPFDGDERHVLRAALIDDLPRILGGRLKEYDVSHVDLMPVVKTEINRISPQSDLHFKTTND